MRTVTKISHHRNAYRSADICIWSVANVITTKCVYTFFFLRETPLLL